MTLTTFHFFKIIATLLNQLAHQLLVNYYSVKNRKQFFQEFLAETKILNWPKCFLDHYNFFSF